MRKLLTLFLAVACFLAQTIALAAARVDIDRAVDGEHAALHALEGSHHHHDDGSIHFDGAGDSGQHSHADSLAGGNAAPPPTAVSVPLVVTSTAAPAAHERPSMPPYLEGLRRPPRTTS